VAPENGAEVVEDELGYDVNRLGLVIHGWLS
jgi:hypothetical protein